MESRNGLLVGQIALDLRLLTREQLQQCLDLQAGQPQPRPIGTLLRENGFLTEEQLARVVEEQKRRLAELTPSVPVQRAEVSFGRLLVKGGHASEERVNEALRAQQDLAERGVRKRLGELLVESGHLAPEVVPAILKLQGKILMSCTFCGTHMNVVYFLAEGFPCRKCGMPLSEKAVTVSAEDTAYLLPAVDPRIATRRTVIGTSVEPTSPAKEIESEPPSPPANQSRRRLAFVLLLVILLALLVYLLSRP